MYRPRQWVLSFGCLFSDAMGTAAWARCEQVSKHCSKPLSTVGMDKDEASLLQADLKLHSKMHDQEDYTPSEEERRRSIFKGRSSSSRSNTLRALEREV
jgi:hypothetical protein